MLEVTDEEITSIVATVFEATLGMTVSTAVGDPPTDRSVSSSLVGITGRWDGAVIVACTRTLAIQFATTLFGIAGDEIGDDEINDALGELANMVGGNFKSLLPPPCSLSLPTVVNGRDYRVRLPGAKTVRELDFHIDDSHLRLTVAERAA